MKVLVDTHAILWWLVDDMRLSGTVRRILEDSSHERMVSIASLWEIAIKMSLQKLTVRDLSFAEVLNQLRNYEFQFLPIRFKDLERLGTLPWHHRDPFDRLLIAQSMEEGIPLMTSDSWVEDYALRTVW
jgi:PIN domain nuclease of toxin-antitoxin system